MARRHGRCPRGERLRVGIPHGHVWTPLRMQEESSVQVTARDRVLPCVRPLLRHGNGRRPVWECEGRDHITGTRSKRSPCAWFSRPRLTDVAPYLFLRPPHIPDGLRPVPPTRKRPELGRSRPSSTAPMQLAQSYWPAPRSPASAAYGPTCDQAMCRPQSLCA